MPSKEAVQGIGDRRRVMSRLVPVATIALLTGFLAGCYETRSTLSVTSTSDATLTHSHYVFEDAFGGDTDAALEFVENTYPGATGIEISKDGYVGKRYVINGFSRIESFVTDTGDRVEIETPRVDGRTIVRVSVIAQLRDPDNNEGYQPPLFTLQFPSNWTFQVVSTGGGRVLNTVEGLTFVGPDAGNSWTPVVDLNPPVIRRVDDDEPDIEVLEGNGDEPDFEVLEPETPDVDIIEPGDTGQDVDSGNPVDPNSGGLGVPGDFDDFYGNGGSTTSGGDLPGGVDVADLYDNDGNLPSIEDLLAADDAASSRPGGAGLLTGVFTGLALGGLVSGVIVLVARRKQMRAAEEAA